MRKLALVSLIAIAFGIPATIAYADIPAPTLRAAVDSDGYTVLHWEYRAEYGRNFDIERSVAGAADSWEAAPGGSRIIEADGEIRYVERLRLGPGPYCFRVRWWSEPYKGPWDQACIETPTARPAEEPPAPAISLQAGPESDPTHGAPYQRTVFVRWENALGASPGDGYELHITDGTGNPIELASTVLVGGRGGTVQRGIRWDLRGPGPCAAVRAVRGAAVGPFSSVACADANTQPWDGEMPDGPPVGSATAIATPRAPATGTGVSRPASPPMVLIAVICMVAVTSASALAVRTARTGDTASSMR